MDAKTTLGPANNMRAHSQPTDDMSAHSRPKLNPYQRTLHLPSNPVSTHTRPVGRGKDDRFFMPQSESRMEVEQHKISMKQECLDEMV